MKLEDRVFMGLHLLYLMVKGGPSHRKVLKGKFYEEGLSLSGHTLCISGAFDEF